MKDRAVNVDGLFIGVQLRFSSCFRPSGSFGLQPRLTGKRMVDEIRGSSP
jgi:hypothetical protein